MPRALPVHSSTFAIGSQVSALSSASFAALRSAEQSGFPPLPAEPLAPALEVPPLEVPPLEVPPALVPALEVPPALLPALVLPPL
jgi:hypothetical protein